MPQAQAHSFYQGHSFHEGHTWWFIREQIGQDLRERYEVPKELPRELRTLVRKLDYWSRPTWSELHTGPRVARRAGSPNSQPSGLRCRTRRQDHPEEPRTGPMALGDYALWSNN
jgi:hypothetical protein